jgi:5,10-methylenetetrahydromethanopterin reductase
VQLGVTLFPDFPPERLLELGRLAEAGGFAYLGIADSQSLVRDVYVALTALARETRRIRIGPTVTNPLTRHPAVTASAIASLDEACGGRAFLGVGSGDSAVLNLGLRPARLGEMREFLCALRELLQGGTVRYRGREIHTRWVRRPLPLVLAAEGPKTLELGGEVADAVLVHTGLVPEILWSSIERVRKGERRAGRRPGSVAIWAFAKCNVGDTREAAIEEIKMGLAASAHHAFRSTLEEKHLPAELHEPVRRLLREYVTALHERTGPTRNAALPDELGLTDYLARRFAVVGDPETCRRDVARLSELGVDVLFLTAIGPDPERIVRRLCEEVLAPLRDGASSA